MCTYRVFDGPSWFAIFVTVASTHQPRKNIRRAPPHKSRLRLGSRAGQAGVGRPHASWHDGLALGGQRWQLGDGAVLVAGWSESTPASLVLACSSHGGLGRSPREFSRELPPTWVRESPGTARELLAPVLAGSSQSSLAPPAAGLGPTELVRELPDSVRESPESCRIPSG